MPRPASRSVPSDLVAPRSASSVVTDTAILAFALLDHYHRGH
nr:hypothetical protein [Halomonas sp.]